MRRNMERTEKLKEHNWTKPELIILTHSNEDEVLTGDCKLKTASIGPVAANNKCDQQMNPNNPCGACQAENGTS
jgi:hypothetical protein